MSSSTLSRRALLQACSAFSASFATRASLSAILTASAAACTAKSAESAFTVLADEEAAEFAAMAARIFPTTVTPGATEAGVIHYFDNTFGTFHAPDLPMAREGLTELLAMTPGGSFAALGEAEQDALLTDIETGDFFQLIRYMTICGMFGLPEYGGNQDNVGEQLLGLTPHMHAFVPPFGYYDAEATGVPYDG